jgi:type I restriction enzyme S subunit
VTVSRYERYKDSGVQWLGDVPAHWETKSIRRLFEIKKRIVGTLGFDVLSITQQGIKKKDTESNDGQISMDYSKYQLVEPGDFAMNQMDLLTGYVDVSHVCGVTSPDYRVFSIRNRSQCFDRYFLYLLQTCYNRKIFYAFGKGASQLGRWRLPTDQFNDFVFPIPSIQEQEQIALFLDRETAKIDALINGQQRMIGLLKEKRQAAISHAVTKGLDPNAPMKESGVEWLGDVPEHWATVSARRVILHIEQGWSPECDNRPAATDEWGILKAGCVNHGVFQEEENKALPELLDPIPEYEVRAGDVLMSRASGSPELVGSTAYVAQTRPRLMLSDKIFRIQLVAGIYPKYFVALFNSLLMRSQIERAISGADGLANNLPQSSLRAFDCPIAPTDEQISIVTFLEKEISKIDKLTAGAEVAISLFLERRSALISAAVTGKIDVRGLVVVEAEAA